jgi:hypothetical protein
MNLIAKGLFLLFWLQTANAASVSEIYGEAISEVPNFPEPAQLSETEKVILNKFRTKVGSLLKDDYERSDAYLLGWLASSKWNIFSSEQKLKRAIQWKRVNKISGLGKAEIPKDLSKIFPYTLDVVLDKNGCPVFEQRSGKWNVSSYMLSHEYPRDAVEKYKRYGYQLFAKIENNLRTFGGRCTGYTGILDFDGLSMSSLSDFYSMSAFTSLFKALQNVWPGLLKDAIVINAPANMKGIMEMFKPMVADFMLGKFNIYFGKDEWKPALLSIIDASELTPEYGGTKNIPFAP